MIFDDERLFRAALWAFFDRRNYAVLTVPRGSRENALFPCAYRSLTAPLPLQPEPHHDRAPVYSGFPV